MRGMVTSLLLLAIILPVGLADAFRGFRNFEFDYGGSPAFPHGWLVCANFVEKGRSPKHHGFVCGLKSLDADGQPLRATSSASITVVLDSSGTIRCVDKGLVSVPRPFNVVVSGPKCGVPRFQVTIETGNGVVPRHSERAELPIASALGQGAGTFIRHGKLGCVVLSTAELAQFDARLASVYPGGVYWCARSRDTLAIGPCTQTFGGTVDPTTGCFSTGFCRFYDAATGCAAGCSWPDIPICLYRPRSMTSP